MIHVLLRLAIRRREWIFFASAALLALGLWAALRLPIDAVPDITNPMVQVNTVVPSLAPEEIEKLVTFPLEVELAGIPHLEVMRSLSKFGLSQVTLIFRDGTDIYRSRQLVSELGGFHFWQKRTDATVHHSNRSTHYHQNSGRHEHRTKWFSTSDVAVRDGEYYSTDQYFASYLRHHATGYL